VGQEKAEKQKGRRPLVAVLKAKRKKLKFKFKELRKLKKNHKIWRDYGGFRIICMLCCPWSCQLVSFYDSDALQDWQERNTRTRMSCHVPPEVQSAAARVPK